MEVRQQGGIATVLDGDPAAARPILAESLRIRRETGDRIGITQCLMGFAGAANRVPLVGLGILQYLAPCLQLSVGLFIYHEPIRVGDRLYARFEVVSVSERFGADIVVTRNVLTNERGEVVLEASTTLMGQEGEASAKIKFDAVTGQVTRAAVD